MSDRPQAVRTGVRPEGAAGADGAPATGSAPATGQTPAAPAGASAVGAAPAGAGSPGAAPSAPAASLTKPISGAVPAQQAVPADATVPPPSAGQGVPPAGGRVPQQAPQQVASHAPAQQAPQQLPPQQAQQQAPQQQGQAAGRPAKNRGNRGPRRARLQLRHIDTWSALKISLVVSIAMFFIWMVAVGILFGVLSGLGVFDTLNDLFGQLGTASGGEGGGDVITPGIVFGGAAVIGAINIVLMTALCTVAAFIYNLCADLVGGLEVTLAERD
ncbi:DUF3566 domain-containing protein [Geodermatophilus sp. FMUSA9-8]|uniref:DUF3566 domain-containing protein n=1 Tax=Geodermatophilus sp. FMUSA9-8 TaxID=3120155 RepID=UPI00300B9EDB